MTLQATFSLTPQAPYYYVSNEQKAYLYVWGADFFNLGTRTFENQYAENKLFLNNDFAADPTLDYSDFHNRRRTRHIKLHYDLRALGTSKELALIFGFEVTYSSPRLLIYTSSGLLSDVTLVRGDNQVLIEVESLDTLDLYFIHAQREGHWNGGDWFFKGISGYVV